MKMKTWKLVSGILSIVLFVLISLQYCAVGIATTLEVNGKISGSAGIIVSVMLLIGGIVSLVTRKVGKGGNITLVVLFGIGALCNFTMAGSYSALYTRAAWCFICAILAISAIVKENKKK